MSTKAAASFVASLDLDSMPEEVLKHAKLCVMDTLGVMLGGIDSKAARVAREVASLWPNENGVTIFGTHSKASPFQAAFANCVASSALDMDDGHNLGGHPGGVIVPAVLAAAEAANANGKEFLEGVIAGYEIAIRAMETMVAQESGLTAPFPATGQPYHSTGTGAAYGAAAGAAKVLNLDVEQISQAINIASAHTPATRPYQIQTLGHTTKECLGWAGITGIQAAYLAKQGFTGPNSFFDDDISHGTSADTIGYKFEILNNYFKAYPSCRYTHATLDGVMDIISNNSLKGADIKRITVSLKKHHSALNNKNPISIEQAQYSFPFVLGAVLSYGHHGVDTMNDGLLKDSKILREAEKIHLQADDLLNEYRWPGHVSIETVDGRMFEKFVPIPKGDPQNPLSEDELNNKFNVIVLALLEEPYTNKLKQMIDNLEGLADIHELSLLLNRVTYTDKELLNQK